MDDPSKWNIFKFGNMVRYIVEEYPYKRNIRIIHYKRLHKLCYLCDFDFFELYGRSITGSTYVHGKEGPVPIYFDKTVKELVTDDIIEYKNGYLKPCSKTTYRYSLYKCNYNSEMPNDSALSDSEMETIDQVLNRFSSKDTKTLTALVKDDTAWMLSRDCQALNYGFAYYRSPELTQRRDEDEIL